MPNIEIYIKNTCPFCHRAMDLLRAKNVTFTVIDLADDYTQREVMIARSNGRTTVPQIFINDQHIGGCDDLFALEAADGLNKLLS